jgi:copper transport protein
VWLLWASTGLALAHASLARSDPEANSTLPTAPPSVTVWFDEAIEPNYSNLSVFNSEGQRIDNLNTTYIPALPGFGLGPALTVGLPPLPQGSYLVSWRVLSTGDSHPVGGAFAFGIGVPPDVVAAEAANRQANPDLDWTAHASRSFNIFGQTMAFGGFVFLALIWPPAARVLDEAQRAALHTERHRLFTLLADALAAILLVGLVGALYVQMTLTGWSWALFGTRWGLLWIGRALTVLALTLMLECLLMGRRPAWLGLALSAALVITSALNTHSAAKEFWFGPMLEILHQGAVAVWVGGLLMLLISLWGAHRSDLASETRAALTQAWIARFAGIAAVSVGIILPTGLGLSQTQVGSWAALWLTPYGQALLFKLALAFVAFGLGAYNACALHTTTQPLWRVTLESVALLGALLAAVWLADLPPAASALLNPTAPPALVWASNAQGYRFAGQITPARLGSNIFAFQITDLNGQPVCAAQVDVQAEPVGGGGLTGLLSLTEGEPGTYAATGALFTRAGRWQLLLSLRPANGPAAYVPIDLEIGPDGVARLASETPPNMVQWVMWLNQYGLLVVTGLLFGVVMGWLAVARRVIYRVL